MQTKREIVFPPFRLDVTNFRLWREDEVIIIRPKTFDVLRCLVERAGQLVIKEEILATVWPGARVSSAGLKRYIQEIRAALGDSAQSPRFVEAVARRGYRFIGNVLSDQSSVVSSKEENHKPDLSFTDIASQSLALPDKPSIVVLPFANLSGDPTQEYFSDGMTEEVTATLSRIASLFVIARTSAFAYKGKGIKIQDISCELGVRYVLEGSVRKADGQIRIIAQLIDAMTGGHLWAEHYNRPSKDIFAVQDEIVQKIVTTLQLQLTVEERGYIERKTTDNLEAYDTLLRGVELFSRTTKETNAQARQMFEKALVLDPQYAEAYAWLGGCYLADWIWRWNADPQTLECASTLAYQALALNDSLPRAYSILSNVYAQKQQYEQAIAEGVRAIALDPNNDFSCNRQGAALNWAGRPAEALPLMEQAMRLNPHYPPFYLGDLGWTYNLLGRHAEAVTTLKEAVSRGPTLIVYYFILANSYVQQWATQQEANAHTLAHALAAAQQTLTLNNSFPRGYSALGSVYLWQKQYEQALVTMEQAITLDPNTADGYARLAEALSRIGRSREGVGMAEQALHCKSDIVDLHLNSVGTAYYLAGKPAEAIAPLQQYLTRYPNILSAHLMLAAVYSELGQTHEARQEVAEVLRINSTFSMEVHKERAPIRDPATLERHLTALRKAGLK